VDDDQDGEKAPDGIFEKLSLLVHLSCEDSTIISKETNYLNISDWCFKYSLIRILVYRVPPYIFPSPRYNSTPQPHLNPDPFFPDFDR